MVGRRGKRSTSPAKVSSTSSSSDAEPPVEDERDLSAEEDNVTSAVKSKKPTQLTNGDSASPPTPTSNSKTLRARKDQLTAADQAFIKLVQSVLQNDKGVKLESASKDDLVKRLRTLSQALTSYASPTSDEDHNRQHAQIVNLLRKAASELASRSLTKLAESTYKSLELRSTAGPPTVNEESAILIASSISDILRITVPTVPYSDDSIITHVWRTVLLPSFRHLHQSNNPLISKYYHVFETLVRTFTFAVLVDRSMLNEVVTLFETLFEVYSSEDLPVHIESLIEQVLGRLLDYYEPSPPLELIECVLQYLDPHESKQSERKPDLAIKLLQRAESTLQMPVCDIMRALFLERKPAEEEAGKSKKRRKKAADNDSDSDADDDRNNLRLATLRQLSFERQVHILYELLAHCPTLLTPISLDLEYLLEVVEPEPRLIYVTMYGKLLTRQNVSAQPTDHLLHNFMKRYKDINVVIRRTMCNFSTDLLLLYPLHSDSICENLSEMSTAAKPELRIAALDALLTAARTNLSVVTDAALQACGRACMDVHRAVRINALESLADLFNKYSAPAWRAGRGLNADGKRTAFVPRRFALAAIHRPEMIVLVDHLIDTTLLGHRCTLQERVLCMIALWMGMSGPDAKLAYSARILKVKYEVQLFVRQLLVVQQQLRTTPSDHRLQHRRTALFTRLHQHIVFDDAECTMAEFAQLMTSIIDAKDKHIAKWLSMLASPLTPLTTARNASSELMKAVMRSGSASSNSTEGTKEDDAAANRNTYTAISKQKIIYRLATLMIMSHLSADALPGYLTYVQSQAEVHRHGIWDPAMQLLLHYGTFYPVMFTPSIPQLTTMLSSAVKQVEESDKAATTKYKTHALVEYLLQLLAVCVPLPDDNTLVPTAERKPLLQLLKQLAISGTPLEAKYAVRAIHRLYNPHAHVNKSSNTATADTTIDINSTPTGDDAATKTCREIVQQYVQYLHLEYANRLETVFTGLAELCASYPFLYDIYREQITKFVMTDMLQTEHPELTTVRPAALSLLVAWAKSIATQESDHQTFRQGGRVMQVLLNIIRNDGRFITARSAATSTPKEESKEDVEDEDDVNSTADPAVLLLKAAAIGAVDLLAYPLYRKVVMAPPADAHANEPHSSVSSPSHKAHAEQPYHLIDIALLGEHRNKEVRTVYEDRLRDHLRPGALPFWLCHLLVFAGAATKENPKTMAKLKSIVRLGRDVVTTDERAKSQASKHSPAAAERSNKKRLVLSENVPETWLFDFLYTLSYHPGVDDSQCDNSEEKYNVYDRACNYIESFLDALFIDDHEEFALILAVLASLKWYEDVRNPRKRTIYKLADLTGLCVHHRMSGKKFDSSAYNGKIAAPALLYRMREGGAYTKTTLPSNYLPPRQRTEEHKRAHKENEHTVVQDLMSPSKKRKGSTASVAAASRDTSPARKAGTKSSAAKKEAAAATPTRDQPRRSKQAPTYNESEAESGMEEDDSPTATMATNLSDLEEEDEENQSDDKENDQPVKQPSATKRAPAGRRSAPRRKQAAAATDSESEDVALVSE